jgi:hypothetical protein
MIWWIVNHFLLLLHSEYCTADVLIVTKVPSATETYKFTPGLDLRGYPALNVFS